MEEIWKDIAGYEGRYQVSNLGKVRSLDRYVTQENRWGGVSTRIYKGKLLKSSDYEGYQSVVLTMQGTSRVYLVHRLVAQAFILNPDNLPQVNHKDENPSNNCVDNLEWCTAEYNSNYGTRNEKLSAALKGIERSPEHCRHISESHRGSLNPMYNKKHSSDTRAKISAALKGVKRTEEYCKRQSESHKGKIPWNKGKTKPVICLDQNITFASSQEAAEWLGMGVGAPAVEYASRHIACCGGHVFVYIDNLPKDIQKYIDCCYTHSRQWKHLASRPVNSLD